MSGTTPDTLSEGRRRAMLRTAMGPTIAAALADPLVLEVMVNPDGALRLDWLGEGRTDTGVRYDSAQVERIIKPLPTVTVAPANNAWRAAVPAVLVSAAPVAWPMPAISVPAPAVPAVPAGPSGNKRLSGRMAGRVRGGFAAGSRRVRGESVRGPLQ